MKEIENSIDKLEGAKASYLYRKNTKVFDIAGNVEENCDIDDADASFIGRKLLNGEEGNYEII